MPHLLPHALDAPDVCRSAPAPDVSRASAGAATPSRSTVSRARCRRRQPGRSPRPHQHGPGHGLGRRARRDRGADAERAPLRGSPDAMMQARDGWRPPFKIRRAPVVFRSRTGSSAKDLEFEPAYLDATGRAFGAALEPWIQARDGEGAPPHNGWVEETTEKRIRDLVPQAAWTGRRPVLVTAIYFLGYWEEPFAKEATRPAPFSHRGLREERRPHHARRGVVPLRCEGRAESGGAALQGRPGSMLVVLPDAVDGLPALEASLTGERLESIVKGLSARACTSACRSSRWILRLPGARRALRALGWQTLFLALPCRLHSDCQPSRSRDRLFISEVFHKAS